MNYFRTIRDAIICVALLAIPFFFLGANLKNPEETSVLDGLILQASAPLQWVASETADAVSGLLEEYVYLVDVKADNDRLALDNARLREENRHLRLEARENRHASDAQPTPDKTL